MYHVVLDVVVEGVGRHLVNVHLRPGFRVQGAGFRVQGSGFRV